jgi:hypothetical protein
MIYVEGIIVLAAFLFSRSAARSFSATDMRPRLSRPQFRICAGPARIYIEP